MGKIIPELSAGKCQREDNSGDLGKRQAPGPRENGGADVVKVPAQSLRDGRVENLKAERKLKKVSNKGRLFHLLFTMWPSFRSLLHGTEFWGSVCGELLWTLTVASIPGLPPPPHRPPSGLLSSSLCPHSVLHACRE